MTRLTYKALSSYRKAQYTLQDRRCYLCNDLIDFPKFYIDHDHKTGRIRMGLCSGCNSFEGLCLKAKRYGFTSEKLAEVAPKVYEYVNADWSQHPLHPTHRVKPCRAKK